MADQRGGGIAWCDETWNPIRGCSRVSPGCEHCYAERTAARFSGPGQPYEGLATIRRARPLRDESLRLESTARPRWTGEVRLVPEHLGDPLRWRRPRRVFVNSMSDLFHEKLSNETIAAIFGVMAAAPQHTFQVLTKRPGRMREWFDWITATGPSAHQLGAARGVRWYAWEGLSFFAGGLHRDGETRAHLAAAAEACKPTWSGSTPPDWRWPLSNVWLGVTAEDQQRADERIPLLLGTPAAARFVSVEPQIGPVQLRPFTLGTGTYCFDCGGAGVKIDEDGCCATCGVDAAWFGLDWVICGAESGPGARPFDEAWARSLRDQCAAAGVAFFYKQALDQHGKKVHTPELDGVRHVEFPR